MRVTVDELARTIIFSEDAGDEYSKVILFTPHRARAVGQALMEIADGLVAAEERKAK